MPNGKTHKKVALVVGAGAAFFAAKDQPMEHRLIETMGGAFGGRYGGVLPDLIDPATNPNHRSWGHGVIPATVGARYTIPNVGELQKNLRDLANTCVVGRENAQKEADAILYGIAEIACRLGAGAVPGLIAGYISHLALDAGTPKSLPPIS